MSGRAAASGRPVPESGLPPLSGLPAAAESGLTPLPVLRSSSRRLWPEPPEPSVFPPPVNRGCAGCCAACTCCGCAPSARPAGAAPAAPLPKPCTFDRSPPWLLAPPAWGGGGACRRAVHRRRARKHPMMSETPRLQPTAHYTRLGGKETGREGGRAGDSARTHLRLCCRPVSRGLAAAVVLVAFGRLAVLRLAAVIAHRARSARSTNLESLLSVSTSDWRCGIRRACRERTSWRNQAARGCKAATAAASVAIATAAMASASGPADARWQAHQALRTLSWRTERSSRSRHYTRWRQDWLQSTCTTVSVRSRQAVWRAVSSPGGPAACPGAADCC